MGRVTIERSAGTGGGMSSCSWGMKDEEFMADFCLVSKRALERREYAIFRFHYLLGADWKLCCRRLKMDRGSFFHELYRMEQKLGRVYRELQPHSLFPLDEYFGGTTRQDPSPLARAKSTLGSKRTSRLMPPLRAQAAAA